ncbi:hypothetical protein BH18ACT11_BH18ACT11_15320 [soil metagenome]
MEQAGIVIDQGSRARRAYEKYGWVILSASAILGIIAALVTTLPPISWFWDPLYESAYSIMGALGVALVGFNVLALVVALVPYRRDERWAWFTLWMLPLMWISQFVLAPDLPYLMLALLTMVGLVLPYRRFFSRPEESVRVK